jgi:Starch-binding associating with outer membrane
MQRHLMIRVLASAAFTVSVAACHADDITKVNANPNNPVQAPAPAVFTNAAVNGITRFLGWAYNGRATALIVQHLAQAQYPDEDTYRRIDAASTSGYFNNPYTSELEDLQKVIDAGTTDQHPGIYGPALALQQLFFEYLTDTFGDIPYSEALKGDAEGGVLQPKYDAQKDIYASMMAALTKAATDLADPGSTSLGSADPLYGGDATAWQKFANTLHARMAMRLINVDPTTAATELQNALNGPGGVFESNADNAVMPWPGDGVFNNDWSDNFKTRDDHRLSRTLMDIMLANNDPRVPVYAQPTTADPTKYAGMPNGLRADSANKWLNIASRLGPGFFPGATAYGTFGGGGASRPTFVLSYAELQFIRAEAAERGIAGLAAGQAKGFYEDAITASLNQWGITDATAVADFLAQPGVAYKGGVDGLKQIAVQKWIALFTDGGQAWAEWRRTCQPSTIVPGPAATPQFVPRRLYYSTTEASANSENVAAAVARQGPDDFGTRVYWDTNPTAAPTCQ